MKFSKRRDYLSFLDEMLNAVSGQLRKVWNYSPIPIVKIQVGYFLHLMFAGKINNDEKADQTVQYTPLVLKGKEVLSLIKGLFLTPILRIKYRNQLRNKILLAGYYEHSYTQGSRKINLYVHPCADRLNTHSKPNEVLLINNNSQQIYDNELNRLYIRLTAYHRILLKINSFFSRHHRIAYENARITANWLSGKGVMQSATILELLVKSQCDQQIRYKAFRHFLKITKPRSIWTYCYYDNTIMAMIRAANDLGIDTIEYQHSVQSNDHFAYTRWHDIDKCADLFPRKFWLWRQSDADLLKANFSGVQFKPEVLVGGNIFLAQRKMEMCNQRDDDKHTGVLVSLQGFWLPEYIENFIENSEGYKWYVRLHPRYQDDKEKLEALRTRFPEKIKDGNKLSLYELFGKVQHNITAYSGTALEGHVFGVHNIIFGEDGYSAFREYIDHKIFDFVTNQNELSNVLAKEQFTAIESDPILTDIEKIDQCLMKL